MVGFNVVNLIALLGILLATLLQTIMGQNCNDCPPDLCCTRSGMCGSGEEFCGFACLLGPCNKFFPVSDTVTVEFFNGIKNGAAGNTCPGLDFYWRGSFLDALKSYTLFGQEGTTDDSKREIAAFFAHVTYETGNFCKIEEIDGQSKDYCSESEKYPCAPGKQYYGRGPLQLSWNFNYGFAGESIGFDGLNAPETVANDPIISFKTALWFWTENAHPLINSGQGFGGTTRAIAQACNGEEARINYYKSYCEQFGVSPGDKLTC